MQFPRTPGSHNWAPPPVPKLGPSPMIYNYSIVSLGFIENCPRPDTMDPQNCNQSSLPLAANLIVDAQENFIHIAQRAENAFRDLEPDRITSMVCRTSQFCTQNRICSAPSDTYPVHPKLRRCRKYNGLRNMYKCVAEIQKIEVCPVKAKVVYIRKSTTKTAVLP